MRVQYREKYFEIKNYLEVYIYPVYKSSAKSRSERSKPTSAAQAALNDKNSKLRLARILAANFTEDDIKFELTYSDCHLPESDERAAAELRNFIRRVNRRRKKNGLMPCKYITATERGEKKGRYHHHVVMSGGLSPAELAKLWGRGYINKIQPLQFNESGLVGIAKYFPKKPLYYKHWNESKGLIHPEGRERTGRLSNREVERLACDMQDNRAFEKHYPGYYYAQGESRRADDFGAVYLHLRFYKKDCKLSF